MRRRWDSSKTHHNGSGSAAAADTATFEMEKMESIAGGVAIGGGLAVVTK